MLFGSQSAVEMVDSVDEHLFKECFATLGLRARIVLGDLSVEVKKEIATTMPTALRVARKPSTMNSFDFTRKKVSLEDTELRGSSTEDRFPRSRKLQIA